MESPTLLPMVSLHDGAEQVFSTVDEEEEKRQRQPKRRQQKGWLFRISQEEEEACYQSHLPGKDVALRMWENTDSKLKYTAEQATNLAIAVPTNSLTDVLFKTSISLDTFFKRVGYVLGLAFLCYGVQVLIFGVVPLGEPDGKVHEKLVWLLLTNPMTYTLLSLVLTIIFYAIVDESRPFRPMRHYLPVMGIQYLFQVFLMLLIYSFTDTFILMGMIPFISCIVSTLLTLKKMEKYIWLCRCSYYHARLKDFRAVCINLAAYIALLCVWTIVYRQASSDFQFIMPYILLILVFAFKKWMLGLSDKYPLVIAMLLSGLLLENLDDVFQTLVFPTVAKPGIGFFTIGLRKFMENAAYLLFFTDGWFNFRVWIKDALKRFFTCKLSQTAVRPINEDEDVNDRGHSNMKPGYWRRQAQFFLYKIISQMVACVFFLSITPILRFGVNSDYYPFSAKSTFFLDNQPGTTILSDDAYRDALIFSGAVSVTSLLSGFFGFICLRRYREVTFNQVRNLYKPLFTSPQYLGLLFVVVVTNQLLALAVVQYHNRIWFYNIDEIRHT